MSDMTEPAPEPRKKRKYTRRKLRLVPRSANPPPPRPAGEFAGLTINDCCRDCSPRQCVISGRPYCAHPRKGGLQAIDLGNSEAVARQNRAAKMLTIQIAEDRHAQR